MGNACRPKIIKRLSYTQDQEVFIDNWETTQLGFKKDLKFIISGKSA